MQKITTHLWFDKEAREAAEFYVSIFPQSRITGGTKLQDTPSGSVVTVTFELLGREFQAISAGPYFKLNPSISFFVTFKTKDEVDRAWARLSEGGMALMELGTYPFSERYGWVQDRYGLSWQIGVAGGPDAKPQVTPMLLFVGSVCGKAEEAIEFWTGVFPNSRVDVIQRRGQGEEPEKEGTVRFAAFSLLGASFAAMDSALEHPFGFNEAISFMVHCETQEEIDRYWQQLSAVPEAEQCGWLKDKYGLSWQIVPTAMEEMLGGNDRERTDRVTQAFLQMKKLDVAKLRTAYEGQPALSSSDERSRKDTAMTEPRTQTLNVPGASITYDVRDPEAKATAPVLLLIGHPMDATGFSTLAGYFRDRTVVTYDPRGTGRSEPADRAQVRTPELHAEDLHRLISGLNAGPVDIFASSGGAVNALALVAQHPEDVHTLVAHEPPIAPVLPDHEAASAAIKDIRTTYEREGFGPAMAKFIVFTSLQGPVPADYAAWTPERPAPKPADFGLPTSDDGSRADPLLGASLIPITHYVPDFKALQVAPARIVIAAGVESEGTMAQRAALAIAERLNQELVIFPSHHGGFLGGESGYRGDPDAFAPRLRQVLAEEGVARTGEGTPRIRSDDARDEPHVRHV